uniref:Ketoacyl_synth_N domain-containing protein n=1 Tax=Globodera pallida TaxID=36090 RepID=A0A183BXV8_GLOPA
MPKVKIFEFHSNFLKNASSIFLDIDKPRQIVLSTNYSTSKDIESGGGLAIVEAMAYCNMEQKPTDFIVFGNSAGHQNSENSFALPVANLAMSKNCTERKVLLEILLNDGTSRILYVHEPDFGAFKTINVNLETAAASMTSDSLFDKVQNLLGKILS